MDVDDADGSVLPESVPQPIRDILGDRLSVEALGCMIWYGFKSFHLGFVFMCIGTCVNSTSTRKS